MQRGYNGDREKGKVDGEADRVPDEGGGAADVREQVIKFRTV